MSAIRGDGRKPDELRPLTLVYEGLDRADGSARFGFGDTKALASISGPIEVRLAVEQPSKATFEVVIRPLSAIPGTESKSLSAILRSLFSSSLILSQNPRTLVQLVVQSLTPTPTLRYHPALVASIINASTLALLNAGSIPMRGVVCAVAVGRFRLSPTRTSRAIPTGGNSLVLIVDPSESEASSLEGGGCFAFLFGAGFGDYDSSLGIPGCEVVWTNWHSTTPFNEDELARARELARVGAKDVWRAIKDSVQGAGAKSEPSVSRRAKKSDAMVVQKDDAEVDDKMEI
ncbi:hypothetical protein JAAARDRAFT_135749 [Jaapia argillacea MUCL 33604]|uniref:Exoribonuclease phosphorolytic domain-containing protein n=1 Tax=Jaapia argillacea MUCL 33604 TaxID=933084 RepID=A0A067PSD9_9AGAM|nr:hypothetical protein JAAARDRAFT_135749 [Jaapia argillacea MUCL 33604]